MSERKDGTTPGYMRMSVIQSCAVDDLLMTDALLAVLVALGSYASERNRDWLWASQETIARRMGKSRQAIGQMTRELEALGYVEIQPRYREDGGRSSNWVRLCFDFKLPDERLRSLSPRKKSGRGGRPRVLKLVPPETPVVSYPPETPVVSPPETPVVSPPETPVVLGPETQWSFTKNLEEETGIESGKGNARDRAESPSPKQKKSRTKTAHEDAPPPPPTPPALDPVRLWSRAVNHLRSRAGIPEAQIINWIVPMHATLAEVHDGVLCVVLSAPGTAHASITRNRYHGAIAGALGSITGRAVDLIIEAQVTAPLSTQSRLEVEA